MILYFFENFTTNKINYLIKTHDLSQISKRYYLKKIYKKISNQN